ncbi:TRAP transporter small permease [Solicola gregarius]|uniref:TRAP transporter small permease n=1 Tax=Solicola gregarius TaxID=2908642 RepID=A0AA46TJ74_9ACTN|nr:TRAP transporter small permease [Solicola gregarius]UYM06231.1 TRAP transporter small permease [Solicola gregarius]
MTYLRKAWRAIDAIFEAWGLLCLVGVVFVVLWQVVSRELFGTTPTWSEETSRILLIWIGFLSAAIGFREGAHIAISFVVDRLPDILRQILHYAVLATILALGLYLTVQGAQFTADTQNATLPGTGLPRSALYVMMPVAGVMICLYSALQAAGVPTQRFSSTQVEAEPQPPRESDAE